MDPIPMRPVTVVEMVSDLQRHGERTTTHLLLLQDDLQRSFNLPIGPCEALGVKVFLDNELIPRPITHDLILNVLTRLGAAVDHVVVDRADDYWRARVHLRAGTGTYAIEANAGDAVALALRANATIFATEEAISGEQSS